MSDVPEFVTKLAFTEAEARALTGAVAMAKANHVLLPDPARLVLDALAAELESQLRAYSPLTKGERVYYLNDKKRTGTLIAIEEHAGGRYALVAWDEPGRSPVSGLPYANLRRA